MERLDKLLFISFLVLTLSCVENHGKTNKEQETIKVITAINAGGPDHTDSYGILYSKDPLTEGIASDFGMHLNHIYRVPPQDEILYRTERYGLTSFGYDIPLTEDGKYVLVLKFCEVYFQNVGQKVFDVSLNAKHRIVSDLDIFSEVGFGTAHQEVVAFQVKNGGKTLVVEDETSKIKNGRIKLDFEKGSRDNPKINAFFVIKGLPEQIPPLPALPFGARGAGGEDDDELDFDDELYDESPASSQAYERKGGRKNVKSGPVTRDPWESESPWLTLQPVLISMGVGSLLILILYKWLRRV